MHTCPTKIKFGLTLCLSIYFLLFQALELQPLEEAFSKVKYFLKRNEVIYDSTSNLSLLVTLAFTTVTSEDCIGYIDHAGYNI